MCNGKFVHSKKVTSNRTRLHSYTDVMYFGGQAPLNICVDVPNMQCHTPKNHKTCCETIKSHTDAFIIATSQQE